jgi:hypothetical protein
MMGGRCFEGYVVNRYGSYDVLGSGYKYIHCDLIDCEGYMTMTLTFGSYFAISFSPRFNSRGLFALTTLVSHFVTSLKEVIGVWWLKLGSIQ